MLTMAKSAQEKFDLAKNNNDRETMEYWAGYISSLKELDIFLYMDVFKNE